MKSIVREDGWTELHPMPSPHILQLPTYQDWSALLIDRGVGTTGVSNVWNRAKLSGKLRAETITQVAHIVNGEVKLICLGCGLPWARLDMNNIIIGGLIRMADEQQTGPREITIKTKVMPVSKRGLGCPPCQERFFAAIVRTNTENAARERLARVEARLAVLEAKGSPAYLDKEFKLKTIKLQGALTAWIDVFDQAEGS